MKKTVLKSFFKTTVVAGMSFLMYACNTDDVIIDDDPMGGDSSDNTTSSMRPVTNTSSVFVTNVFEWTPAPGQFINDPTGGVEWPTGMTPEQAAQRAMERLSKNYAVSLGAFGGYIVTGFDHSVVNKGKYEIGILGNAFISASGSSNEPGIVYVMQDTNGNGEPDDTWYELKGSDTFAENTIRDYIVTYYRPDGPEEPVKWTDNLGNHGEIAWLGTFHNQPYYYPVWIQADRYTVSGTCLAAKTVFNDETGNWMNPPFEWGYADNIGQDNIDFIVPNCNRFSINDAIDAEGKPVKLEYIDFVKIQTGVSSQSGWLGEVSTEVLGVVDLNLIKQ